MILINFSASIKIENLSRKVVSYILGALLFIVLIAARTTLGNPQDEHIETHQSVQTHEESIEVDAESHGEEEGFDATAFIFDHILDSYEWHILTYKDFHLSIPLPVIIYSESKGLSVFLFSKFHHGHSDYNGFRFLTQGENRGKIVEVLEDGSTILPALDLSFTKNVFAILISLIVMLWIFLSVAKVYSKREGKAPTGLQNLFEPIILFIRDDVAKPSIGEKKYMRFLSLFRFM